MRRLLSNARLSWIPGGLFLGLAAVLLIVCGPSDRVADTGQKILVIGLDGADWQILQPMIEEGDMPVLGRLMREGAWAQLRSSPPLLSPLLWTTVATGRSPADHGILDFLIRDPVKKIKVPITGEYRRVPALWNLFTDAGRSVDVVAWWATWPAESIRGRMVTDRVAYSLFGYQSTQADRRGATFPESLLAEIDPLIRDPDSVSYGEIRRFIAITREEYDAARQAIRDDPKQAYRDPINHLARILASTSTYASVARKLLEVDQPDLFLLYFQGIDEVSHRFAHFMAPRMERISEADFRKFRSAVREFYRYQDELLGELLSVVGKETVVMVLSDHGFQNGSNRPDDGPADIEGKPAKWHRLYGIWILHGPPIRPGAIDVVSINDIAPTILYLADFPLSEQLVGNPIQAALKKEFLSSHPIVHVPAFDAGDRQPPGPVMVGSPVDEEMVERLRSLGYLGPAGGETKTTVTYHSNLGGVYLQQKEFARAEKELNKALSIYSEYIPALQMLIQVYTHQENWEAALAAARSILASGREFEPTLFLEMARIQRKRGTVAQGLRDLRAREAKFPRTSELSTAIGILELEEGNGRRAEAEFWKALKMAPQAAAPMAQLFQIYKDRGEVLRLWEPIETALEKNPKSVMHRNWMGLLRQAAGDLPGAEKEFRAALRDDPEFPGTQANLGALYGRMGRLAEAEEILRKAVDRSPNNIEARVNLGAVLGKSGKPRAAAESLEEAIRLGYRTPDLYNAMGRAYFEADDLPRAIEALNESLSLDPGQTEIREILLQMENGPYSEGESPPDSGSGKNPE